MQLDSYRRIFTAIGLIGILLFASPTIAVLIKPPSGQQFSELHILGPNHTLENMPFNIVENVRYLIYIGIGNELGHSTYYSVYVKIGNQNDSLPNRVLGLPTTLPPLYEYKLFVQNGANWETPLTFQVHNLTLGNGASILHVVNFNGIDYPVNKKSVWSQNETGYYYTLIVELWIYNATTGNSQFHNRFVSLNLNITSY